MARPISPASPLKSAGHRFAMAAASLPLMRRHDERSRAVARALRRAALGRLSPGERRWAERIEARRAEIERPGRFRSPEELGVVDLGAAVEWMSVPRVLGAFLMCLVRELGPSSCLEVGTGFGLSGAYQAAALELNGSGELTTVEVNPRWAAVAQEGFAELGLDRITISIHERADGLQGALSGSESLDYAFIDADHREGPTIDYLERILPYLETGAVVVFDDVGFTTEEMARAWRAVASHPRVALALRLSRMGIVVISEPPKATAYARGEARS